ncbi:MAG TPA: hypothetical protein VHB51_02215 [Candidatus Saccharimonadales bacterium]|nr:hypothetical protein [Candidatus Saccharimonadales bacterium]
MSKRIVTGIISAGILLLAVAGAASNNQPLSQLNTGGSVSKARSAERHTQTKPKVKKICDGTTVISDCTVDGVNYSTYIYHQETPEKTHTEKTTTYQKKVIGYCTLCNDGTYSPTCATGRGACSYHGGVAEWNAPEYENVPVTTNKTVVDSPAEPAYYEKVVE